MSQSAPEHPAPEKTADEPPVILVVDEFGVIETVGGGWQAAAEAGGAADSLNPESVIGRPLACFVGNDTTRMYYETVLKLCRLRGDVLSREYRCDSPSHKRFMRVTLTPLENGRVEMRHQLLLEVPFDNALIATETEEADETASSGTALRCSVCNQIRLPGETQWIEPETLVREAPRRLSVIHTVCPVCKNTNWLRGRRAGKPLPGGSA